VRLPLRIRLEPLLTERSPAELAARFTIGVAGAFLLGGLILMVSGHAPAGAYSALLRGAFSSSRAWAATLNKAVPIGLCAIGIALAARAGLWNIGAEGQLYAGAIAATGMGFLINDDTPALVGVSAVVLAGMAAGMLWAGLAAAGRAYLGVNEIIGTLLLNYVAILFANYLVFGPWADPTTVSFPFSPPLPDPALMSKLPNGIHHGIFFLAAAALLLWLVDRGSRWGYELRVEGDAPMAARYGGISDRKLILAALSVAGGLAGLSGAIEVSAVTSRLQEGLSPGYGFIAILVAWIGGTRPLPILIASVVYAGFLNGAFSLQVSGVPAAIGTVLQSALLLCVLATQALAGYRVRVLRT
jgi:ABC-type uncharacterized transport system permease subunit